MLTQPYDTYRDRLAALATDEIPLAALEEASWRCGWWRSDRQWQRTYARFHLGETPLVTLIYETVHAPPGVGRGRRPVDNRHTWLSVSVDFWQRWSATDGLRSIV